MLSGRRNQWRRYRELAEVLARYGLGMALEGLGLLSHLPLRRRLLAARGSGPVLAWVERIPRLLSDLGPTYVKLGQLASTRSDILPEEVVRALEHLQDDVPPFATQEVISRLEAAWGRPLTRVLAWFNPQPLAAASIGQVHQGTLWDGRRVVVKVRRPRIVEKSAADFNILRHLADVAERRTDWGAQYQVKSLVEELIRTMRDELDFLVEARNTDKAHKALGPRGVRVPEVIWELTRSDVLVLEEISGVKISDRAELLTLAMDPRNLAHRYVQALYQQIFVDGFFHADPHPGNVHVDAKGHLIFLDWGLVGILSPEMRAHSVDLVLGLAQGRSARVVDGLMGLGAVPGRVQKSALLQDVDRLRHRYYEANLDEFRLGDALTDLFHVARAHHIRIPAEYTLLARAAVSADGVVRRLNPGVSLVELGKPLAQKLLLEQVKPRNWGPALADYTKDAVEALAHLPLELTGALATLSQGEIRIVLEHKNIDKILQHWEQLINRVALSFLLAALIIATGMVVHRDKISQMARFPLGEYAFIGATALAAWIIVGAVRRGKL